MQNYCIDTCIMTSQQFSKFCDKVIPYAVAYGAFRKALQVRNATEYNFETKIDEPLFLTTKLALIIWGGVSGSFLWPINCLRDVHSIEAYMRQYPISPPRHAGEYIFN